MATPIFLTISIYIGPTRLLELGLVNAKYDSEEIFCKEYTSADWGDDGEIDKAMAINNNKKNDKGDL